jgi:polysaccharide pyruvyl transferase WcaK-like protein
VNHRGYALLNIGDIAMLHACVSCLRTLSPDADIQLFTEPPQRLEHHCPGASAVVPTLSVAGARQSRACKSLPLQTLRSRIEAVLLGDTEP